TWKASANPGTPALAARAARDPSPSCPRSLAPQQLTMPPAWMAQLCSSPSATLVTRPGRATGDAVCERPPSAPSCPRSLPPQQKSLPALATEQLCIPPAATSRLTNAAGRAGAVVLVPGATVPGAVV